MTDAVRTQGLFKRYGPQVAVAGVDLVVPAGSFAGLVGPNGAGKTTTLSMITGLLRPDGGRAEVDGLDVWRDQVQVKARIGVLPEGLRLFERLSGRELLHYSGRLRGIPKADVLGRAEDLLQVMDLAGAADKLVVDYSTGMRKKIGLAAALLHNPSVLFLDEPFEGVDPVSANTLTEVLQRFTASGSTVIFSSHVMDLVERLCDWVSVMNGGHIVAQGPLEKVRGDRSLNDTFLALVGGQRDGGDTGLTWLGAKNLGAKDLGAGDLGSRNLPGGDLGAGDGEPK
ncbi:ABC transporter ATP-binding protein [Nonomuraea cavernae]|uniref:ABC transporter ATP-binding protein n=1 Tax=Nonomuraea cavernae TaxID=2045107 RepID=A0A918DSK9_9ACTN|nr:ABC transporter ATP-binding protein [Nonomuraea cavernae]MCA2190107.1 ABC transporter ATP-binding protein [Nonomuraea cavernae]GGO81178.1 ABC transporter ATP-binding protein [Nonomuraea cavernae]